jgi:putative ABC transport system permease protein
VTLAAGAYPAFVLSGVRPVSAIATGQGRLGSPVFATLLVGVQFGVASFLLIALTVITAQNAEMRRNALSAIEDPLVVIDNNTAQTQVSAETLRERLEAVPQVRGVTEISSAPWESLMMTMLRSSQDPGSAQRSAITRQVGFDFFAVFEVPLVAGRVFDRDHAEDTRPPVVPRAGLQVGGGAAPGAPPASGPTAQSADALEPRNVVVDRALVEALGLGTPEEAVDALIYPPAPSAINPSPRPPWRIVGVVEDRSFSFFKTPANVAGTMYTVGSNLGYSVARIAADDIEGALSRVDGEWRQLAPNVAISRRFLDEIFEGAYAQYVRTTKLFGTLAVMAFAICVAGLFGMATFVAGRRKREIGVRKTLGASTQRMVALLLASFALPVLVANVVAWPAGYLAARAYLNQFAESIEITAWPFVFSVAVTVAIACLAVAGQTLRAARTTPAQVLRHE